MSITRWVLSRPAWLWHTIHEPRFINLIMSLTYMVIAGGALTLAYAPPGAVPWWGWVSGFVTVIGGVIAALSAWVGWWGVESPAAGVVVTGLGMVTVGDVMTALDGGLWHIYPLTTLIALTMLLVQRMMRISGRLFEPGMAPVTELDEVRARVRVERMLEADRMAALAVRREMLGGGGSA